MLMLSKNVLLSDAAEALPSEPGWLDEAVFCQAVQALPLVSVDLVVTNPAGEMLLGLRCNAPAREWWFTPGSRVHKNETLSQALQRVMSVELGLLNPAWRSQPQLMGPWDHFYNDSAFSSDVGTHYVNLPHRAQLEHQVDLDSLLTDQHTSWRWQDPHEAAIADDVHPYVRLYAQRLMNSERVLQHTAVHRA